MTTMITGGCGFIGLALAERLLANGERVVLFDCASPPAVLMCHFGARKPQLVVGDIRSAADIDDALHTNDVDRVIHAAAITPDAEREAREPLRVVDVNIAGTVNLLQRCALAIHTRRQNLGRVLVLSSVAVYGVAAPLRNMYEEGSAHPEPLSLYGITKLASEQAALRLADLYKLDVRIARLGPVFGPWEYATGVRDALSPHQQVLAAALAGESVVLPRSMRADWLYSRDAALALVALTTHPGLRHAIYNVGGAVMTDLNQWCDLVAGLLPQSQKDWSWRQVQPNDVPTIHYGLPVDRAALAIERLQSDIFWSPAYSLAQAAADQMAWETKPVRIDDPAFPIDRKFEHGTS